jgi:hypothetical protein
MKTFAQRPDQVTRFTSVRACSVCGTQVLHHQVARFDRTTGFKTYAWEPTRHRCTERNIANGTR